MQLAVRMDESISEEFLQEPLRFYGDVDEFRRAVSFLTKGNHKQPPKAALTPVILSGLIAAQQAREHDVASSTAADIMENWPTASELVSYCTNMRRQALQRIARKRKLRKFRFFCLVALVGFVCGIVYNQTITSMENNMMELGYTLSIEEDGSDEFSSGLRSCADMTDIQEENVCRAAEAATWAYFRDFASAYSAKLRDCTRRKCLRDSRNIMRRQLSSIHGRAKDIELGQGPYTMHTIATRETLLLKTAISKSSLDPWWAPHEDDGRIKKGLQWLGDTTINQMVRTRLLEASKNLKSSPKGGFRVLDVGCGIGGTLYALAGAADDRWSDEKDLASMDYVGIGISSAEIMNARRLASEHEMDLERIQFQQVSFDSPALRDHGKFAAAVAIESLSYSPNVSVTLSNLASVIQSGGTLIVVDDIVQKQQRECHNATGEESVLEAYSTLASRPSLLTHSKWMDAFDDAGFVVTEAMDIGLQFSLPQLIVDGNGGESALSFWDWAVRAANRSKKQSLFLSLLRKWEAWTRSRMGTGTSVDIQKLATLQVIQLMQKNIDFIRSKAFRKQGHERLELMYNMYVCTKR